MKTRDVPQDKGLMDGRFEDVCYALDENGNYVPVLSAGWEPKNEALRQAWGVIDEEVEQARQKVLAGEFSPIYFFMQKNMMDVKLLAEYMEIRKRKVRRHIKPSEFTTLDRETLEKYAKVFDISVERLINFNEGQARHAEG
jgi:plasmid maintenance system antidote protein VapI